MDAKGEVGVVVEAKLYLPLFVHTLSAGNKDYIIYLSEITIDDKVENYLPKPPCPSQTISQTRPQEREETPHHLRAAIPDK